jgi:5-methylcytosine-specific restriction endonuclease McrA
VRQSEGANFDVIDFCMKSLKTLSNEALHKTTQSLVAEERKLTTSILWHLHEIQSRRLHSEMGYGSLFDYAVKALGYSEAAAGRRIAAMRLLADVPEAEPALQKGDLSLSTLCTLQHFFQRKNEPVSRDEKKSLVFAFQGKSRRECEKELAELDPKACAPAERERAVSATQTEIRFVADDSLMEKLTQIREFDAHVLSENASYLELFHRMADLTLKKLGRARATETQAKAGSSSLLQSTPSKAISMKTTSLGTSPPAEQRTETNTRPALNARLAPKTRPERYIPAPLKRQVWLRDQGRCSFRSSDGRRCESRFALEIDHRIPLALEGKTNLTNLRLLCRPHNRHQAVSSLGASAMRPFIRTYS